jgi:hypothetical protein
MFVKFLPRPPFSYKDVVCQSPEPEFQVASRVAVRLIQKQFIVKSDEQQRAAAMMTQRYHQDLPHLTVTCYRWSILRDPNWCGDGTLAVDQHTEPLSKVAYNIAELELGQRVYLQVPVIA